MNAVPRGPPTGVDDGDSSRRPTGVDGDVTRDVPERSRCPRFGFCTVDGLRLAVRLKCRTSLASVLPVHVRTRHTRVHVARSTADSAGPYPARGARTDRQVRAGDHARGPRLHLATRAGERGRFVRGGKAGLDIRCRTRTSRGATHRVGAARNAARAPRLARSDHTYREGARHGERDAGVRGASEGDRRLLRPLARGVRRCRPSRTECRGHDLVARRHRGRDRAHREHLRLTMRDAIANLPGSKIRELANAAIGRDDVLAFWFGESDDVTPEPIREAAITSLRRGETFYASNLGLPALREAIARYVSSLHRPCAASRIAVPSSGVRGLMIAMQALAGPGDEVYERLYFEPQPAAPSFLDIAEPDDRLVVINSFSKSFLMTGWRLGWMVVPEALTTTIGHLIEFNTSCAPVFVQRGGIAALAHAEKMIGDLRAHTQVCRDTLVPQLMELPGVQLCTPRGGMYAFFRIAGHDDSYALAKRLETHGIGLAPGVAFGDEAEGWLRWCFASRDPARLTRGVERLAAALATRAG